MIITTLIAILDNRKYFVAHDSYDYEFLIWDKLRDNDELMKI